MNKNRTLLMLDIIILAIGPALLLYVILNIYEVRLNEFDEGILYIALISMGSAISIKKMINRGEQ